MTYERPEIVCLCGSTRFKDTFAAENFRLTLDGKIVLSIGCDAKTDAELGIDDVAKSRLDELHLRKIDLADCVHVLNVGGYIGQSTRNEINYAAKHKKPISFLEEFDPVELDRLLGDGSVTIPSSSQTTTQDKSA